MGLKKWRIIELSALLPHLLQFALILFFVGLSVFLYELDQIVAGVTIGMASIWAAFLIIVNITPFFSVQSPYMSFKDLVFGMENQVEQVIGQNVASTLAVLAHAQNVLQGEPLRKTFLQCFQGFDISNWMISEYILALSKGTKPSQIHGWLPPSPRDEDKTVSGIFLDLIQNDIHLDRLCATETPSNEYMTPSTLMDWRPLHESLSFTVWTACQNRLDGGDEPLHLAQLALLQHSQNTATLGLLSFYRAIKRHLVHSPTKAIWWQHLELDDVPDELRGMRITPSFLRVSADATQQLNLLQIIWVMLSEMF